MSPIDPAELLDGVAGGRGGYLDAEFVVDQIEGRFQYLLPAAKVMVEGGLAHSGRRGYLHGARRDHAVLHDLVDRDLRDLPLPGLGRQATFDRGFRRVLSVVGAGRHSSPHDGRASWI